MKASETARKIIEKFGTNNVYAIAEKAGVKIVYENWHPVTIGEFDRKSQKICVNLRAVNDDKFAEQKIIAHELGHFFADKFDFDREQEEIFACNFAAELTKNTGD